MMTVFFVLLGITVSTRLIELAISSHHRKQLFEKGASDVPDPGFPTMVALHVGILVLSVVEALTIARGAPPWLGAIAATGVVLANGLRIWAIVTLGTHWNVRVVDSTSLGVVTSGPYRLVRHPNYVAVFVELALLPCIAGAWLTAGLGTMVHFFVLRNRIDIEERTLLRDENYRNAMASKPRFLPGLSR